MGLHGPSRIGSCCGCECVPEILARQTVRRDLPPMILTPYQGPNMACPGSRFRLQESNAVIYCQGTVDSEGRLPGLISSYQSSYSYYGYMRLEIGCVQENGSILWPTWTNEGQFGYP
jgi:hypothetical protein